VDELLPPKHTVSSALVYINTFAPFFLLLSNVTKWVSFGIRWENHLIGSTHGFYLNGERFCILTMF
jgi:hypothetical protein